MAGGFDDDSDADIDGVRLMTVSSGGVAEPDIAPDVLGWERGVAVAVAVAVEHGEAAVAVDACDAPSIAVAGGFAAVSAERPFVAPRDHDVADGRGLTKINDPDASDQVLAAIFGPENAATNWHTHFRTWRKRRLREIEVEYGDRLDKAAEFLAEFASKIKALGPAGYLRSTSHRAREPVLEEQEA